jgi:restriction system protein
MIDPVLWGIHAGKTGHADSLFKSKRVIALGWEGTPDLSSLPAEREAFKAVYRDVFPDANPGNVTASASQLYRFVHELQTGDLVAYASPIDRRVHLGRVTGAYKFVPDAPGGYCHQRSVEWLKHVPRTRYSQGALYELGAALSLFQIRNYAEEHHAILAGEKSATEVEEKDETVGLVVTEIQQGTRDFVLKTLTRELKGHPFTHFVAHLLETMGYHTRIAPPGPDGGVDIVASRDELGFEPPIIKVQVKAGEGSIGNATVASLYGNIGNGEFGLFVTLGGFTKAAQAFGKDKGNLRLIDSDELTGLVLERYDQLDAKYKGLLPLQRVYIPEVVNTDDGP